MLYKKNPNLYYRLLRNGYLEGGISERWTFCFLFFLRCFIKQEMLGWCFRRLIQKQYDSELGGQNVS